MARSRLPVWLMAAMLVLVMIAIYWPVTGYDFVNFDDPAYVSANAHVQAGLTWENIRWASTTLYFGLWHPLTWVSHMLDCQLFGLRSGGHHLTSLLLHAANAVLLFVVFHSMTGALWRPALVATLFGLHPLHVESVAWVAERKDVLSTFFVLLTLWAYGRYAERSVVSSRSARAPATDNGQRTTDYRSRITDHRTRFYLLSLLFFALGLMSKPMVVTLPLVLLLLDYWPLKRFDLAALVSGPRLGAGLLVEKLPFVMGALLVSWLTLRSAHQAGWTASVAHYPLTGRIANATLSYARYCLQVFWPAHLAAYYPLPATFPARPVAGAALLLVGISVGAFWAARRWPYILVGWLWYLVTLLPVIGLLIQLAAYSHADRYTYVPLIGLFVSLVWGGWELVRQWGRPICVCAVAAVAAAVVLCIALTEQQLGHWKNSEALFRHALEVTGNNQIAYNNLGEALDKKGQTDEAIRQYQEAIRLKPAFAEAHNNLAAALDARGQTDEAIGHYQEAIRLKPAFAEAHNNLGSALFKQGRTEAAIHQFQEVLRQKPDSAEAHYGLGKALAMTGQTDEAIRQYQEAIRQEPGFAEAHNNLGIALDEEGQTEEAIRQYQEAIRQEPGFAEAHNNLGIALGRKGQSDAAIREYQEALRLEPGFADAHNNLGNALLEKGQLDEAIGHYQEALRLKPDYAEAVQQPRYRLLPARPRCRGGAPVSVSPETQAGLCPSPQEPGHCARRQGSCFTAARHLHQPLSWQHYRKAAEQTILGFNSGAVFTGCAFLLPKTDSGY